ncbi:MAG: PIN domain-containing protein [Gemmatimonadaceae bacterium]
MVGLDTNVLVRFLVEDDPRQSAAAASLISRAVSRDEALFISEVVLCETVWVLSRSYRLGRAQIAGTLRDLLRARHLLFSFPERISRALDSYAGGNSDFADYVIREMAWDAGCGQVATFDGDLLKERGFALPSRALN